MNDLLKKIAIISMLLGTIAVALNMIFGDNTITFISQQTSTYNITYYRFDFLSYIRNLNFAITDITSLSLKLPTRTWSNVDIANNLALMLDWILLPYNVWLYPFRIGAYTGRILMTVIGIDLTNTQGNMYWLVQLIEFLIDVQLPMI